MKQAQNNNGMWIIIVLIIFVLGYAYKDQLPALTAPGNLTTPSLAQQAQTEVPISSNGTISIESFNLQIFGVDKMKNEAFLKYIPVITSPYDVIVVQEIRDASGASFPALVDNLAERNNRKYAYVISERLGSTDSKEQYGVIYDASKLKFVKALQYNATGFERPPFAVMLADKDFMFTIIDVHTKPENAKAEIIELDKVVTEAKKLGTNNIIIAGDLNAACGYFKHEAYILGNYTWIIHDDADTSVATLSCSYDRFIVTPEIMPYYTGISGVNRYDVRNNVPEEDVRAVSDHYPIYMKLKVS